MKRKRNIATGSGSLNRRDFIKKTSMVTAGTLLMGNMNMYATGTKTGIAPLAAHGPASAYKPRIKAAFVRRKEDYGMWWPGAVYDGKAAKKKYTADMQTTANSIGAKLDLKQEAIFSIEEAKEWIGQAKQQN